MSRDNIKIIKVSGKSPVAETCGSIIKSIEDSYDVECHWIGAGAGNQAYKAIAKAGGILRAKGRDLTIVPGFGETEPDETGRTKTIMLAVLHIQ